MVESGWFHRAREPRTRIKGLSRGGQHVHSTCCQPSEVVHLERMGCLRTVRESGHSSPSRLGMSPPASHNHWSVASARGAILVFSWVFSWSKLKLEWKSWESCPDERVLFVFVPNQLGNLLLVVEHAPGVLASTASAHTLHASRSREVKPNSPQVLR